MTATPDPTPIDLKTFPDNEGFVFIVDGAPQCFLEISRAASLYPCCVNACLRSAKPQCGGVLFVGDAVGHAHSFQSSRLSLRVQVDLSAVANDRFDTSNLDLRRNAEVTSIEFADSESSEGGDEEIWRELVAEPALIAFRAASHRAANLGLGAGELDQRWYEGPHQSTGGDEDIPLSLSNGETGYARQRGEYVRPRIECVLGGRLRTYVSGVYFTRQALRSLKGRRKLLCELVPEPGNWFDCEAVAVDVDQQRVGYLPFPHAHAWHEIVRRLNARSLRVVIPAILTDWTDSIDDVSMAGITLFLPFFDERRQLVREIGIATECDALLSAMSETARKALIEGSASEGSYSELGRFSHLMSSLPWNKTGSYSNDDGVPSIVRRHVDELRFQWKTQRKEERAAEKAAEEARESDTHTRVLKECYALVLKLRDAGAGRPAIAREVGVHPRDVTALVDEAKEYSKSAVAGLLGSGIAEREIMRLPYRRHAKA